jgi:hypothetical protein
MLELMRLWFVNNPPIESSHFSSEQKWMYACKQNIQHGRCFEIRLYWISLTLKGKGWSCEFQYTGSKLYMYHGFFNKIVYTSEICSNKSTFIPKLLCFASEIHVLRDTEVFSKVFHCQLPQQSCTTQSLWLH